MRPSSTDAPVTNAKMAMKIKRLCQLELQVGAHLVLFIMFYNPCVEQLAVVRDREPPARSSVLGAIFFSHM
jgi:hypothetical protein